MPRSESLRETFPQTGCTPHAALLLDAGATPTPSSRRTPGSISTLAAYMPAPDGDGVDADNNGNGNGNFNSKMDSGVRRDDGGEGTKRAASARVGLQSHAAGFTLVELMVVIVIIGLLATMVMINVMPSQDRAMVEKARADVSVLEQAMETYRLDNLVYPTTEQGLAALVQAPAGLARPERYRQGGYVRRLPEDPWGNAYQYRRPGRQAAFDVYSFGADGAEGGEGENSDIGNWP